MQTWIDKLKLERHVEGGYFGLFYQASDKVLVMDERYRDDSNPCGLQSERAAGSSIYFLLEKQDFSAWHQLKSDEIWHYYDGGSVICIHTIDKHGQYNMKTLGNPRMMEHASFQELVKADTWFAAELQDKSSFGLVGCTVFPGFEYQDFELADRAQLASQYPEHTAIIHRLTR